MMSNDKDERDSMGVAAQAFFTAVAIALCVIAIYAFFIGYSTA